MIWTDKPLFALDTETTGADPETARIITVCLGYSGMRGQFGADNWLINPGVPIPAEATKVHGITDETASVGDDPAEALEELRLMLDGIAFQVNEKTENIGARRLYTVMEKLLEEISFDAGRRGGEKLLLDGAYVDARLGELAKNEDLSRYVL